MKSTAYPASKTLFFQWGFSLIFPAVAALALWMISYPTVMTSDGTRYLLGAKFIHAGAGYVTFGFENLEIIPQIDWPPLFSFLIAGVMKLGGMSDIYALRIVNFLSLVVYSASFCGLAVLIFEEKKFQKMAYGLILVSSLIWTTLNVALSESLFLAWFGLSLFFMMKAVTSEKPGRKYFWFFAAGLATTLLCLTKYSGLFIAAAYGLFFLLESRASVSEKISRLFIFSFPVILGVGGWFLRNKFLSGHLSFLEIYRTRPFFEDFFRIEASFTRTFVESFMGFSTYRWTQPLLTYIPTAAFLGGAVVVGRTLRKERKELFGRDVHTIFLRLILLTVLVYGLAFNFFRLKNGFGENPRYFQVLCPVIFLAALMLIQKLGRGMARNLLIVFLLLSTFFHGIRILKEIRGLMRPESVVIPGVTSPSFAKSPWIFGLFESEIKRNDIVITNDPTFLTYAANRPFRITDNGRSNFAREMEKPKRALEEVRNTSREVYVILDKRQPCFYFESMNWQEYLDKLTFEKIREDDFAIVVKLTQ